MSTVDLAGVCWRKSSLSGGEGGGNDSCVEVAFLGAGVALRDSKNPDGPALVLPFGLPSGSRLERLRA